MHIIYLKNCWVGDAEVEIEFVLTKQNCGLEPNWDSLVVWYLAKTDTPEEKRWVDITDTLENFNQLDKQINSRWSEVLNQYYKAIDNCFDYPTE